MTTMDHVLVVDDDVELCGLVQEYLTAEGFSLKAFHDGEKGLEQALTNQYALVVLDVMLPGINGFEVLRRIRSVSKIPVLLLTARGEDVDRIVGLEIGADDYLPKPFNRANWWPESAPFCAAPSRATRRTMSGGVDRGRRGTGPRDPQCAARGPTGRSDVCRIQSVGSPAARGRRVVTRERW